MAQLTVIQLFCVYVLPIIFAVTVHEASHGYVAYLLGDDTADHLERLSLNPIKHVDIVGTLIVPIVCYLSGGIIIGWAKSVPINLCNLKKPNRDYSIIAIVGPVANFVMAIIWAMVLKFGMILVKAENLWAEAIVYMGYMGIEINLILTIFNLLPIPPLDGSKVISNFLPTELSVIYNKLDRYSFIILLCLAHAGVLNQLILPLANLIKGAIYRIFSLSLL